MAARDVTNLAALHLVEMLAELGLPARAEDAAAGSASGIRSRGLAAAGVLGALVLGSALLLRAGPDDPEASQPVPRPADIVKTNPTSWPTLSPPLSSRDLSELALPSTVSVRCGGMTLSGFFIAPEMVLTRIPADCGDIEVGLADGRRLPGEARAAVQWLGLTQVHVTGANAEPLQIGDATMLQPGAPVVFLSMAGEGKPVLHETRIGTVAREIHKVAHLPLDGTVTTGDIGGPVLDVQGQVVGMVAGEAEGKTLFLPINYAYEDSSLVERPRSGDSARKWKALLDQIRAAESLRIENEDGGVPPPDPHSPSSPPSRR